MKKNFKLLMLTLIMGGGLFASEAMAEEKHYIVGGGLTISWATNFLDRSPGAMVKISANTWIWCGELTNKSENDGRFKIPNSDTEWNGYFATYQDQVLSSTWSSMSTDSNGDNKFRIAASGTEESGIYKITINTSDLKIKAEKMTEPSKDGDFYLISSVDEYYWYAGKVTSTGNALKARLTADLNFSGEGNGFFPLACDKFKFKGEFDGGGHTMSGITIVGDNSSLGFIRYATGGANIHDLVIEGSFTGATKVAGVIGYARDGGTVTLTNVINKATITATGSDNPNAAGFVACCDNYDSNRTKVIVNNCANMGSVSNSNNNNGYCSAFVDWPANGSSFTNCWNSGTISNMDSDNHNLYRNQNDNITATNCYDASSTESRSQPGGDFLLGSTTVSSGELCYKLNSNNNNVWHQTLSTDDYPVPFSTGHKIVYFYNSLYTNMVNNNGFFMISDADDLKAFANIINSINQALNAKLTDDIDMTGVNDWTPIGQSNKDYKGNFDGQGHRIKNLHIENTYDNQALFGQAVGGAIIENIIIDATCSIKGRKFPAGILGHVWGDGVIVRNCGNEANITAVKDGSNEGGQNAAGIVGCSEKKVYISNCYNTGTISGDREAAGICAWMGSGESTMTNCYSSGTVNNGEGLYRSNNGWDGASNNYQINGYQGTQFNEKLLASGELCYIMNGDQSTINWYQNLTGTVDTHPVPFSTHSQVYANGQLKCDGTSAGGELTYSNSSTSTIPDHQFEGGNGWCTVCNSLNQNYLTTGNDGYYSIGTANDLKWFAEYVEKINRSVNAKLTQDIVFSNETAMIGGTNNDTGYAGTFDGQHHKVTVKYTVSQKNVALFRTISNAHIMNLIVDGDINNTNTCAGGIFAGSHGASVVENCVSYVNFTRKDGDNNIGGDATFGGIGAYMHDNGKILNCAFYGSIDTPIAKGNGGLLGYANGGNNIAVENCIVNATAFTFDKNVSEENGRPVSIARNTGNVKNTYVVNAGEATQKEQIKATAEQLSDGTVFASLFAYNQNGVDGSVWRMYFDADDATKSHPVLNGKAIAMRENCNNRMIANEEFDVTLYRTVKTGGWNTVCMPINMNSTQITNYFGDGTKVAMLDDSKSADDGVLHFKTVTEITAGQAYLVYPGVNDDFTQKSLGTVTITATTPLDGITQAGYTFKGVYEPTPLSVGTDYIVSGGDKIVKTSGGNLKGFRAYFNGVNASRQISRFVFDDDETTGIITPEGEVIEDGKIFNLSGQKIDKVRKGLNIVNGKKVVIK